VRAYYYFYTSSFKNKAKKVVYTALFLKGKALAWFKSYLIKFFEKGLTYILYLET
ncbi:hypothetical protein GQ53DRAFT_642893, partial [Thozetella sp. PMI_491]